MIRLSRLEALVIQSGLPAMVPAAQPPLGMTARMLIEGSSGAIAGLVSLLLILLVLGAGSAVRRPRHVVAYDDYDGYDGYDDELPVIRRADAHPDAPPRPPLRANRDLGTPFLEIRAPQTEDEAVVEAPVIPLPAEPRDYSPPPEQQLPNDWDQPLSAYDPGAIPPAPLEPPVRPARIRKALRPPVFNPYERIETFELTQPRPAPAPVMPERFVEPVEPIVAPQTDATIQALLERLERGLARKGKAENCNQPPEAAEAPEAPAQAPQPGEGGLQETLAFLRNLSARG
jgi:hypothetical protein